MSSVKNGTLIVEVKENQNIIVNTKSGDKIDVTIKSVLGKLVILEFRSCYKKDSDTKVRKKKTRMIH